MGCERCTKTPKLYNSMEAVVVTAGTSELVMKVEEALEKARFPLKRIQNGLEIRAGSFEKVMDVLGKNKDFIDLAKRDIKILPMNGKLPVVDQLHRMKTLKEWESLYQSGEVIEVLDQHRLKTHFQPIVDPHKKEIHGYETLIRGYDKKGGLVPPGRMFSMAKESDLLFNMDRQARETNIRNGAREKIQEKLFINFTPGAIYDPVFCLQSTLAVMEDVGLRPEQIVFEVVETEEIKDVYHLKKILDFYREKGFSIALDDIGSGYASLNTLTKFLPDYIKVDMEIIRNVHQAPMKQSIVHSLVAIAREHGIQIIGEGVETQEELEFLVSAKVDYIQGYYMGRPGEKPERQLFNR